MINDLRTAFAFLTILPVGYQEVSQPGRTFAYFPLVGLVIGLILAGVSFLLSSLPHDLTAFLVLLLWAILTEGCISMDLPTPATACSLLRNPRGGSTS